MADLSIGSRYLQQRAFPQSLPGTRVLFNEDNVDLDHHEIAMPGGGTLSFKLADETSFDIILSVSNGNLGNHEGANHFFISPDGKTLIETKTHIERGVAAEGADPAKSSVIKTSTSVLVFHRAAD